MPRKLMFGSQGQDVADLQSKLNKRPPTKYPLLVVDGIFGVKTLARVKEFQSANTLVMDGIVGAKTWDALLSAAPAVGIPPLSHRCGNGDEGNAILANTVTQLALSTLGPTAHSATVTPGLGFVDDNFSFGKTPSASSGSASHI
ncbi:MAG: peptidoglycan-binding protein, partial [Bryobacterales bacterium]|nr:peptidoglycan-binding protein [Bryobacterales bacterium]